MPTSAIAGSEIKTPNIDKLATEGVRLEDFYGMPVCTPSRAQLMTGRYAMRYGLQTLVIFPSHTYGLATDERTLPQALKEAGYKTLMVGKWHLGHADRKYWPQNRGFDYFYGNVVGEVDYFTRERGGLIDWQRNGVFLKEQGYYTTLIGDDAVRLIDQQDGKQPFFLYFASLASHAPYQAPQAAIDQYKSVADPLRRTYSAMIIGARRSGRPHRRRTRQEGAARQHDHPLRQRQRRRDQRAVRARARRATRSAAPKRAASSRTRRRPPPTRRSAAARGACARAACACRPSSTGRASSSPASSTEPLDMVDVMPTLLALAGAKGSPDHPFDGKDMWATIADGAPSPHDDILINVEAFRGAVRKGDWKLIKIALLPGKTQLFNLAKDPGETTDVAAENPEIVKDLEARLLAYAKEQKPSLWIKAQPAFVGNQGKTVIDPDFDIDDSGLPHERMALPAK